MPPCFQRQKGKYTNRGKHLGWYKNGKIPAPGEEVPGEQPIEKVELTYYLNDVSDPLTQVLMTYGEDGSFDAAYTYGLERIEVEALDETRPEAQDPLYYLYDGLGSVTFMVKPDGNKRDHYRYDEFGKPAPGNSKQSEDGRINLHNTFGYTGEQWDEEANLLYLRARYYEPETGRFLSRDTYEGELENPLSKNLYAYVQNNPVNFTDPTGHYSNDTIRITSYNGFLGTPLFSEGWLLHNQTNSEYIGIQILKIIPGFGTYLSIQEEDWLAIGLDAALSLAGPVAKATEATIQIVTSGANIFKAGRTVLKGGAIGEKVAKASKTIGKGKVVYDSIQAGNKIYKNVVVTSENIRMEKNDLVLKMIAETYTDTSFIDTNTLKVLKTSVNTFNVGEHFATRKSLQWCIDTFSEFVYKGQLSFDDLGITESLYNLVLKTVK